MADEELSLPVNLRAIVQDLPHFAAQGVSKTLDGAVYFWGHVTTVVTGVAGAASSVSKSPEALRNTLSGISSLVSSSKFFKPITISTRALDALSTVENFISVSKIVQSADYFVNAKFLKDLDDGKPFAAVAEVCFAAARVGLVSVWAASLNLINLGRVSGLVGAIPVVGNMIMKVGMMPMIEIFYIGGIVGCVIEDVKVLLRGDEIIYRIADLVNLVGEGVILGALVVGVTNPIVLGAFGVVASSAGIAAFLLEPKKEEGATEKEDVAIGAATAGGFGGGGGGAASAAAL